MAKTDKNILGQKNWNLETSLLSDNRDVCFSSSILARLYAHPKVTEVAFNLKWGPVQKRQYLSKMLRTRFNNLKRKAEDDKKPMDEKKRKLVDNASRSRKTYVSLIMQMCIFFELKLTSN